MSRSKVASNVGVSRYFREVAQGTTHGRRAEVLAPPYDLEPCAFEHALDGQRIA
jgi:hypothetical protein